MHLHLIAQPRRSIRWLCLTLLLLLCPAGASAQSADNPHWWDGQVFYEVFVRSFADSTTGPLANDGIGDIQGLIEHLDYINDGNPDTNHDLGATAIWLMPIMQSPSYHGYDTTDYYHIEKDYGTNEDFKRLIDEAHKRGIKVIIDLVLNHASSEHPFFISAADPKSKYHDWFIWRKNDPGYKGPWGQTVWHPRDGEFYYGLFSTSMPDLNYKNPGVTREMLNVTRFWLNDMHADGYRLDAIKFLIENGEQQENTTATHDWLRQFHRFYKQINPDAMTVGEVWSDAKTVSAYIGDQLDLAFDFDQAYAIIHAVKTGTKKRLLKAQTNTDRLFPPGQSATFLANHDMDRTLSQLEGNFHKARLAATIELTSPGVPFIYYGEEIGMQGQGEHPNIRTPMQWTGAEYAGFSTTEPWHALDPSYTQANVKLEDDDPDSLLSHYRKLIRLRQTHPTLAVGDFTLVRTDQPAVYAFIRRAKGKAVLVLFNLSDQPVTQYALDIDEQTLKHIAAVTDLLHDADAKPPRLAPENPAGYQPIPELAPQAGYILELNPRAPR